MKISLITPIYKNAEALRKYLERMQEQTNKNFEIIFVVDTNSDKLLQVIDEFINLKQKIKLIFNTKRQGRTKALQIGTEIAMGEYSFIISVSNAFKDNFIEQAILVAKEKKTDIIEFKSTFKQPRRIEGKIRKSFDQSVVIVDNPEVIALSYPFDFNKMYKTKLLKRVVVEKSILDVNSRLTLAIVYKALLLADTYSNTSKILVTSKSGVSSSFNPLKLIRQWKELFKYVEERHNGKYMSELMYARYFHEVIFLFAFVGASKNKMILEKLKNNFNESLKTDFKEFFEVNQYALRKNKETEVIIQNRASSKLTKLFKEL